MTPLGIYLLKKSINKAAVSRKSGISASRLSELSLNENAHLRVSELQLIADAIDVESCDLLKELIDKFGFSVARKTDDVD